MTFPVRPIRRPASRRGRSARGDAPGGSGPVVVRPDECRELREQPVAPGAPRLRLDPVPEVADRDGRRVRPGSGSPARSPAGPIRIVGSPEAAAQVPERQPEVERSSELHVRAGIAADSVMPLKCDYGGATPSTDPHSLVWSRDVRLPRVVASATLIMALALVVVPGSVGSRTPSAGSRDRFGPAPARAGRWRIGCNDGGDHDTRPGVPIERCARCKRTADRTGRGLRSAERAAVSSPKAPVRVVKIVKPKPKPAAKAPARSPRARPPASAVPRPPIRPAAAGASTGTSAGTDRASTATGPPAVSP